MSALRVRRKWRPPLWQVIAALVAILVLLPVMAVFSRLADDQFVRETERSLIAQAAVMASVQARVMREAGDAPVVGTPLPEAALARTEDRYHPVEPSLSVKNGILEPPPEAPAAAARAPSVPVPAPPYAEELSEIARASQKTTLAGYRFTDASGLVIATSGESVGASLAHLPEVRRALAGDVATVLRYREEQDERHALDSISRDTAFRVYVAHPVILDDQVVGAVYAVRTPINLQKFLYRQRYQLASIGLAVAVGALLIGFIFWRVISRPIHALKLQSHEVATGQRPHPEPLKHYGVAELADLGGSVLRMAETLTERAEAISTYTDHVTHELKSPVTAIVAAAELLETADERLGTDKRRHLISTIHAEGLRMDALLARMRDLTRATLAAGPASEAIGAVIDRLRPDHPQLQIRLDLPEDAHFDLSPDEFDIVLQQLLKNAVEHGATRVVIAGGDSENSFVVEDDGTGITPSNRDKVTEPFFTTRREEGGTGMGLTIASMILRRRDYDIRALDSATGAKFGISPSRR